MDTISCLPDEVLGTILSSLSTKQAALTSVLSKRWRNVFVLVSNLEFDYMDSVGWHRLCCVPSPNSRTFTAFVESLLKRQSNSPIKKLSLKCDFVDDLTHVQSWISTVLERGVMDLDVVISVSLYENHPVPSVVFKSKTLVKLRLGRWCTIKLPHDVYLPMLKTLYFDSVDFGKDSNGFETLVSRCPVLEDLVIQEQRMVYWPVSLSSPSLKRLSIQIYCTPSISLDVPNLVYFEYWCSIDIKFLNLNLDSLIEARLDLGVVDIQIEGMRQEPYVLMKLINAIRNIKVLHLSSHVLELLYFSCQELPVFDNLAGLSIESEEKRGWQILPSLVKNSPNLITLTFKGLNHLTTKNCGDACVCCDTEESLPSCLSSCRVKVLEISGYQGTTRELNQIKHFLDKLPCLELVEIGAASNLEIPIDKQHLLTLPRASSNCKIQVIS